MATRHGPQSIHSRLPRPESARLIQCIQPRQRLQVGTRVPRRGGGRGIARGGALRQLLRRPIPPPVVVVVVIVVVLLVGVFALVGFRGGDRSSIGRIRPAALRRSQDIGCDVLPPGGEGCEDRQILLMPEGVL